MSSHFISFASQFSPLSLAAGRAFLRAPSGNRRGGLQSVWSSPSPTRTSAAKEGTSARSNPMKRSVKGLLAALAVAFLAAGTNTALASPDVDFPQQGQSYGGKVRSGPGINYRQSGSLHEGDRITILQGTGAIMNGYEWFFVRYRGGRTGYHWGGLFCSTTPYPTILTTCDRGFAGITLNNRNQPPSNPPPTNNFGPVSGMNVTQVFHSRGSFSQTGPNSWEELNDQGYTSFVFSEEGRDNGAVYLYDMSRNVHLELNLYSHQIYYAEGNGPKRAIYTITNAITDVGNGQQGFNPDDQTDRGYEPEALVTVRYSCSNGIGMEVIYVNTGPGHAVISLNGGPQISLGQVVSGSGTRYTNGYFTLSSKGPDVYLEYPEGYTDCSQFN